jgi:hypothetical protein
MTCSWHLDRGSMTSECTGTRSRVVCANRATAAEVARLRGLEFEHPVPIRYLAPKDFEKQLAQGDLSPADRKQVTHEEAVFRALGLIGGKVDLLRAFATQQSSGTLAYYDPPGIHPRNGSTPRSRC